MRDYRTPAANTEPRPFSINDTIFECVPVLKADQLAKVFTPLLGDETGQIRYEEGALRDFFEEVMEPESFARFDTFVKDDDNIVHIKLLYQVAMDLFEDYSGRPFVEQVRLLSSRLNGSQSSLDASPSPEQTSDS